MSSQLFAIAVAWLAVAAAVRAGASAALRAGIVRVRGVGERPLAAPRERRSVA